MKMFNKKGFKRSFTALVLVVAVLVSAANITPAIASGDAETAVPFSTVTISNEVQLRTIGSGPASVGVVYVLANSITLTGEWAPIIDFRGTFDGQGHSINNLFVLPGSARADAGLFASAAGNAVIRDVNINIGTQGITGTNNAGALVGSASANPPISITNVRVAGDITASATGTNSNAGGLVGVGRVNFTNVHFSGNVSGANRAGGLIGWFNTGGIASRGGSIERSYVIGSVTARNLGGVAGGLVGLLGATGPYVISDSYTAGSITLGSPGGSGGGGMAGGLFGSGGTHVTILPESVTYPKKQTEERV